jgi:thiamine-phosphate pyrophosphorylase
LRTLTRKRGVLLIVNDRVDVALAVDADGAHVGQEDMPASMARHILGTNRILGVSVSNHQEAEAAIAAGADYLGISPIFPSLAKSDAGPATGIELLTTLAAHHHIPLIAIGGITAQNATEIMQAGADGIAVITAVVHAEDITMAASQLRQAIERGIV